MKQNVSLKIIIMNYEFRNKSEHQRTQYKETAFVFREFITKKNY